MLTSKYFIKKFIIISDHRNNTLNIHRRTCFAWSIIGNSNLWNILLEKI